MKRLIILLLLGLLATPAMGSVANLCITPVADLLGLDNDARINVPGTIEGNWQWRLRPRKLTHDLAKRLAKITQLYGRCSGQSSMAALPPLP